MRWRLVCLLLMSLVQMRAACTLAQASGPFVAGFERFGRHHEIETEIAGRLLIRELRCTACHPSDDVSLAPQAGPDLEGVALRLRTEWIEAFLAAPHSIKPGSTMPDVLGQRNPQERSAIVKSLVAFLATQKRQPTEIKASGLLPVPHEFWNKGDVSRGQDLYHQVGCVACHEADKTREVNASSSMDKLIEDLDADEIAKLGLSSAARAIPSVPLSELKAKYSAFGLAHFLIDPAQFRPAGRMPAFKLSPAESADLTSYLLEHQQGLAATNYGDDTEVARGREWFIELRCIQCHTAGGLKKSSSAVPFNQLNLKSERHCLEATSGVYYALDAEQRNAIHSVLLQAQQPRKLSSRDHLELQLLAYNCYACHERDGRGGVARFRRDHFETIAKVDLGDEGRLPPPLTGVGRKLQTNWLKSVLQGKKTDLRPHMQVRMPIFHGELANLLPELFREVDRVAENNFAFDRGTEQIEIGRQLMDVGCVQCHAFAGNTMPGVIGVDLRGVASRLQPAWFQDLMLNPSAVKSRTRMPAFFPDGKSQRPDLLEGDVNQQIAAMWAYLNAKEPFELPEKIKEARAKNYELQPLEKPIVLRTFMREAGTHALAVGFPQHLHYAFDAEKVRLAIGWRGRFLDAQGTWFVRFAPPAQPLGDSIIRFTELTPFAKLADANEAWPDNANDYRFSGYRLDSLGVPTLLYRWGEIEIEDRIAPIDGAILGRTIRLRKSSAEPTQVWFLAADDVKLTRIREQTYSNQTNLQTTVSDRIGMLRTTKTQDGGTRDEWLIPIEFERSHELELRYQW